KVDLETQEGMNVLNLLVAADELDLQNLIEYVQSYLFDKKIGFLTDNYLEILKIVFRHEELSKLREFCLNHVAEDPGVLFRSPNFYTLDKSLLYLILQQENLAIDEMEICKSVIQWAITQSSMIINIEDILELSSEDLSVIKKTLHEFIPLIRWFQISKEDFSKFQKLFEIILPLELYESVKKFNSEKEIENKLLILPPRIPHIDSKLLEKTNSDSQWAKFARVASVHSAICYNRHLCGPAFGPGWDLVIGERYKHASCWGSTGYPGSQLFFNSVEWNAVHHELEDYEVFQVINKY
ncbi:25022_t:CDS:2, partial [Racocetra persica]